MINIEIGFHCDLKIKLFRVGVIYPKSVNGFSHVTDVKTGFSMWLTDFGFREQI